MNDPLAQFRRKPLVTAGASAEVTGREEYVAFEAKDRVTRLQVRRVKDPSRAPEYGLLMDIVYDDEHWTNFVLAFYFMQVAVRDQNLQPVVAAIREGTAHFIQEFDPSRWERPKDSDVPLIESILILPKDGSEAGVGPGSSGIKMH